MKVRAYLEQSTTIRSTCALLWEILLPAKQPQEDANNEKGGEKDGKRPWGIHVMY